MIDDSRVLAVVAGRGGSKGLPGKNIKDLGGKPLIAWTIETAVASRYIDRVILSTDDAEIAAAGRRLGCEVPFQRPDHLATDESRIEDAVVHALQALDEAFDYVVLLQATTPFRAAEDVDGCIRTCHDNDANTCITVYESEHSPYIMFGLGTDGILDPLLGGLEDRPRRRQDLPPAFLPNGAAYVARVDWFLKVRDFYSGQVFGYPMPRERSIDIDTELDLLLARTQLTHLQEATRNPTE